MNRASIPVNSRSITGQIGQSRPSRQGVLEIGNHFIADLIRLRQDARNTGGENPRAGFGLDLGLCRFLPAGPEPRADPSGLTA